MNLTALRQACRAFFLGFLFAIIMQPATAAPILVVSADGAGEGFNDPTPAVPVGGNMGTTLGAQRLAVFQEAARIWGEVLDSDVPIVVRAQFDPMYCDLFSAVLGGAGPLNLAADFPGAPIAGTWYHIALANALVGADIDPGLPDISATFNSAIDNNEDCLIGTDWYLGLDHNHGGDIDLLVVVLHEFAHGLGFSSFVDETTGNWLFGIPDVYGSFLRDNNLNLLWPQMTNAQRQLSAISPQRVVWTGAEVSAVSGSLSIGTDTEGRVRVYTPTPVEPGSSVSHWDPGTTPNLLMEPFINSNLDSGLDMTDELMADIGWSVVSTAVCGNGILESGEQCDGGQFGGASCGDYGGIGDLSCTAQCTIDASECIESDCNLNGVCEAGENCSNCPTDCIMGPIEGPSCGNGVCEGQVGENCETCPSDCAGQQKGNPQARFCCGSPGPANSVGCDVNYCGESCTLVPVPVGPSYCCGDNQCEGGESSLSCELDCGSCTATELTEATCNDGLDNDCDGDVDAFDSDCTVSECSSREKGGKRCSDGVDNDCDALVDAADPDCQ